MKKYLIINVITLILILTIVAWSKSTMARPTNYCTNDQYTAHVNKITKTQSLLTKWAEINTIIDSIDPGLQAAVRADSRYKRMLAKVSTVTTLKQTHETARDVCVLETDSATGEASTTAVTNSDPVLTSSYVDSTTITTDENGSTVTTVTRSTTITSTVTRATTTTITPYTTYTYNNGETETVNDTATSTTVTTDIVSVGEPVITVLSTTVVGNLLTTTTTTETVSTNVGDSDPVITTSYTDATTTALDSNGSTVTTITRTTVTNSTITRTTTTITREKTVKTYTDGSTVTTYSDNTTSQSAENIVTTSSANSIISQTTTANLVSQSTANTVTTSTSDADAVTNSSYTDANAVISTEVTNGSSSTTTTTSDGDPTQSSSYSDSSTTVDNGDGTSTTTVTRTTTVTTTTPRSTRVLTTHVRNTKTYSTVTRTTTVTSTVVRTTTTNTTPVTTYNWTDGTTTTTTGDTVVTTATENIVTTSSSDADTVTLVSDVDETITDSDVTTTENIVTTSSSSEVISTTTTANTNTPEYYQTDEYAGTNGSLAAINADNAYARGWTGDGVKVGVLDTGVRCTHDDIDDNMSSTTYNTFYGDGCTDTHGHGTHVAGIIAAEKNDSEMHGVAYNAEIHSARIGDGPFVYISLAAILAEEMADNGVIVANLSANSTYDNFFIGNVDGYDGYSTVNDGTNNYYYHTNTSYNLRQNSDVIEWKDATDKGMIIVNSAGNDGIEFAAEPGIYTTAVDSNGDLILSGRMIIVGSVNNNGTMSVWSNKAGHFCQTVTKDNNNNVTGCADVYETKNYYIVAPGETINSLDSDSDTDTQVRSGTSMAAPHVTGAIAILKQAWPQLNADQIISLLFTTATDLGAPGIDEVYGNGMLNLDAATNPQGTSTISNSSGTANLSGTSMMTSSTVGDSLSSISAFDSTMIVDSYNRDYYVDLNQAVIKNDNALTLNHNFKSFSGMQEINYNGYTIGVNDRNTNNISLGFNQGTCGYTLGNMEELNSFLGTGGSGALELGNSTTQYVGINCNKEGLIFKYDVGYSNINGTSNSIITNGNAVSDTWTLGFAKNDFTFTIGQPLAVRNGSLNVDLATSVNSNGSYNYSNYNVSIEPNNRQTTAMLGWNKDITDNIDFNFNIGYNNNYANSDGDTWNASTGLKYEF